MSGEPPVRSRCRVWASRRDPPRSRGALPRGERLPTTGSSDDPAEIVRTARRAGLAWLLPSGPTMHRPVNLLAGAALVLSAAGCVGGIDVGESSSGLSVCAKGAVVKGVDVSHYDGTIDWKAAHGGGIDFAIIKATENINFIDPDFATNWKNAGDNGVIRGAYHFFRPEVDATAQADYFIQNAGVPAAGDLPPTIDLEVTDNVAAATVASARSPSSRACRRRRAARRSSTRRRRSSRASARRRASPPTRCGWRTGRSRARASRARRGATGPSGRTRRRGRCPGSRRWSTPISSTGRSPTCKTTSTRKAAPTVAAAAAPTAAASRPTAAAAAAAAQAAAATIWANRTRRRCRVFRIRRAAAASPRPAERRRRG